MIGAHIMKVVCAMLAFVVAGTSGACADLLDAEQWSNHIEEIQQINNLQQFRRTMNRSFDMMATMGLGSGGGGGAGSQSTADRVAQTRAAWNAALIVPPAAPGSELQRFLKGIDHAGREEARGYLMREFGAYPTAAQQASFNPANVADARLFALQTAFRVVRPNESTPLPATLILSIAVSQQMTSVYTTRAITTRQKQDARDYYVIVRAVLLLAVPGTAEYELGDAQSRAKIVSLAQSFAKHDAGVDPTTTSWVQLPCVGASQVDCDTHMAMARSALSGAH